MKDLYLYNLRESLEKESIDDSEKIIEKIEKRYNLGLEAGLTEEEIEEMLGNVQDIVKQYVNTSDDIVIEDKKEYSLDIRSISDDIIIDVIDTNEIEYELEAVNINYYDISFLDNELKIKYKKTKFLGLNRKSSGNILIKLPKSIKYNNLNISSTSGDIIIRGNIISNTIKINSVSGDISLDEMSCDNMKVSTVSGDISSLSIEGKDVYVDTISGDMGCNMLNSDNLSISTVSGDINITHANANIKASSISGEIIVNGQDVGVNVKKTIKGFFR